MADIVDRILGSRFWALFRKEVSQILHNRQLLIQLLLPPTLMLMLFGFALNPNFESLQVGITDYSNSSASREFIELFHQTKAFEIHQYYGDAKDMMTDLARGQLTVGITIPPEFDHDIAHRRPAPVQALFDAVDANTASVASGYLNQLVGDYNSQRSQLNRQRLGERPRNNQLQVETTIFYNPGLRGAWFIVPGTMGIVLTVVGSQAAASLVVREKEAGTIEQLIMTPASNTEIILAKIAPLLILLTLDAVIALVVGRIAFDLPFRGNLLLFLSISVLYFLVGISIGIMIASYAKSEQQAQLTAFFINPPLVLLSGGSSPITAMPTYMQWLSYLDPMRYFIEVCRGILLKGVGLVELWPQVLILILFAIVLMSLSIRQFRHQLT